MGPAGSLSVKDDGGPQRERRVNPCRPNRRTGGTPSCLVQDTAIRRRDYILAGSVHVAGSYGNLCSRRAAGGRGIPNQIKGFVSAPRISGSAGARRRSSTSKAVSIRTRLFGIMIRPWSSRRRRRRVGYALRFISGMPSIRNLCPSGHKLLGAGRGRLRRYPLPSPPSELHFRLVEVPPMPSSGEVGLFRTLHSPVRAP